ncbi:MAG: T9SS type A sorting domain-containing protein [Chlorobi bacterium]|nr:T9SS type A sorting domain-containing protein [Chlorobiota bacterium]
MRLIWYVVFTVLISGIAFATGGDKPCAKCELQSQFLPASPFLQLFQQVQSTKGDNGDKTARWFCYWQYWFEDQSGKYTEHTFDEQLHSSRWAIKFEPANYCTVWNVYIDYSLKKNSPINKRDTLDIEFLEDNANFSRIFKTSYLINPYNPIKQFLLWPPPTGSLGKPIINTKRKFWISFKMRGLDVDTVIWKFRSPGKKPGSSIRFTGPASYQNASQVLGRQVDMVGAADLCIHVPIPVEMSLFFALATTEGVSLRWKTETETNNYGFEIYRAAERDGPWTRRGFVRGAGSTTQPRSYRFLDPWDTPTRENVYWYLLKQIDIDGTVTEYGPLRVTSITAPPLEFAIDAVFPNPLGNSVSGSKTTTLQYSVPFDADVTLRIVDALGRTVSTLVQGRTGQGTHNVYWNAEGLQPGTYFAQMQANGTMVTRKLVIVP